MDQKNSGSGKVSKTKNNRKTDGSFDKKQIKHDPQSESARTKFGKDSEG